MTSARTRYLPGARSSGTWKYTLPQWSFRSSVPQYCGWAWMRPVALTLNHPRVHGSEVSRSSVSAVA
jgi:hypothetical protein